MTVDKARERINLLIEGGVGPEGWARVIRRAQELGLPAERLLVLEDGLRMSMHQIAPGAIPETNEECGVGGARQLELRIRQLVDANAVWEELKDLAWQLYAVEPGQMVAAKLVELSFLYGSLRDVQEVLLTLARKEKDFYFHIQENLRSYLVVKLIAEGRDGVLAHFIKSPGKKLLPIERLFDFWLLRGSSDAAKAFVYYQQHAAELETAVLEYGNQLKLELGGFLVSVGKLALELEYEAMARRILSRIEKGDPAHEEALQILLQLKVPRDSEGLCQFSRRLNLVQDWPERVKLFYEFFADSRRLGGFQDNGRPALNELLKNPLQWVPTIPEAWGAMGRLLADSSDLEPLLPNLFNGFLVNVYSFHVASLEKALWYPLLNISLEDESWGHFWQAMAYFHFYMTGAEEFEECLWDALDRFQEAQKNTSRVLPISWQELLKQGHTWVAKTPVLTEKRRATMLKQLRIAAEPHQLASLDVLDYLEQGERLPFRVVSKLEEIVRLKGDDPLELRLIQEKAAVSHYTNKDMDRVWALGARAHNYDLCWRVATVLASRSALDQKLVHPWGISGEKRNEYPLHQPRLDHVRAVIAPLPSEEKKLVLSLVKVGPQLPELLAVLDEGAKPIKVSSPKAGTREYLVESLLNKVEWLPAPKRTYRYSFDDVIVGGNQIPSFIQVLPNNTWSLLVLRLGTRLGLAAWGWSLSRFHQYLEGLIPRLASGQTNRYSNKVGRWLKGLSPEQRNAWYDLATLSGKISDDRGIEVLARVITQLALVINQNHFQALQSLQTMRSPVQVIWQMENWILSEDYARIRKKLGSLNRVPVPIPLQKLATILK